MSAGIAQAQAALRSGRSFHTLALDRYGNSVGDIGVQLVGALWNAPSHHILALHHSHYEEWEAEFCGCKIPTESATGGTQHIQERSGLGAAKCSGNPTFWGICCDLPGRPVFGLLGNKGHAWIRG